MNIDYDAFGAPDARQSFEDTLLRRLKERLSWISKRADFWDETAAGLDTVIEVKGDDKEFDVEELEEWADRARVSADFHKDEWRDIVVFMQALIGTTTKDPGAQEPADLDVIETIATRYRARHAKSDEDLARWLGHESAIGAAVANRDSRVSDTAVWRTGAPGRPTGMHLVLTEFARRVEENACKPSVFGEAQFLAKWYHQAHPDAPSMTEHTIENRIRSRYRAWREGAPQNPSPKL